MRKGLIRALAVARGKWIGPATYRLWPLLLGDSGAWEDLIDDSVAYSKVVPYGAKPSASVLYVGCRSVVENQLVNKLTNLVDGYSEERNGITFSVSGGKIHVEGTATAIAQIAISKENITLLNGHKYYLSSCNNNTNEYSYGVNGVNTNFLTNIFVCNYTNEKNRHIYLRIDSGKTVDYDIEFSKLVDLTKWYGIGNEPSTTTDPKMAEVYAYLEAHPEYNAGSIKSAEVSEIESRSADDAVLDSIEIPQALREQYPLRSAGTAYDSYLFESKKHEKKIGVVDLGTLDWALQEFGTLNRFVSLNAIVPTAKGAPDGQKANAVCDLYSVSNIENVGNVDKTVAVYSYNSKVYVCDTDYSTADDFKSAMSGKYLYYELATPVETDISALLPSNSLTVESGGTVTYKQTDSELAVPSKIKYKVKLDEVENGIDNLYQNLLGGILNDDSEAL